MNQQPKHTETSPSSYVAAAYGYDYSYDGFGGSAQASQSAAWSRTLTEHRNSLWITDGSGNVNQYLAYMPFGESFINQRGSNDIRFKFTGKERDAETGFDYFGARYYASELSIWLSVDPLSELSLGMSPYAYVNSGATRARTFN
jgi:RHS repeat-associated protein